MKFTLAWLQDHLDTMASCADIVDALNKIGHEVENVIDSAADWAGFSIARIVTAEKHPQADMLRVLSVDGGDGQPSRQIVCGAPNAEAGLIGVLAMPGAVIPTSGVTLKKSRIRGVESHGMMCSERELGLGEDHDGIIALPTNAQVGQAYVDYRGLRDVVLDVAITPNRQDCMGVRGIARDLAAAGLGKLKTLSVSTNADAEAEECAIAVEIADSAACPAFWGRTIRGVTNGNAPKWMRQRLQAVGQRSISAIVDISNYVMLDLGRPSHAYDSRKLQGETKGAKPMMVARRARDGESVTALNGRVYRLDESMLVIADAVAVHDIAGIMGGEHSACLAETRDIFLEIAYFDPSQIAMTGQKLALASDARSRFERGVDPAFLEDAMAIMTALIIEHCGGTASKIMRVGAPPLAPRCVTYAPDLVRRLGGMDVEPARQQAILTALGFAVAKLDKADSLPDSLYSPYSLESRDNSDSGSPDDSSIWRITVPSWRRDIDGAADLAEEVMRIAGFDNIRSIPLPRRVGVARPSLAAPQIIERKLRRAAAAAGFDESLCWSFISNSEAAAFGGAAWVLTNPISEDMRYMRPSLLPGLLSAAARNTARGVDSLRLFELGYRYHAAGAAQAGNTAAQERPTLAFVLAGDKQPRHWQSGKAQGFDAYDGKAAVLDLLHAGGAPSDKLRSEAIAESPDSGAVWHPGQFATLCLGKVALAEFGVLHPNLLKKFDLPSGVVAAQIFLDNFPPKKAGSHRVARGAFERAALQPITRDFAFIAPESLPADDIIRVIRKTKI